MPYINKHRRQEIDRFYCPETPGELSYAITKLIGVYLARTGVDFDHLNAVVGVLATLSFEFQKRVLAPYEDAKRALNGDVIPPHVFSAVERAREEATAAARKRDRFRPGPRSPG
jgi:hypothetical protein